MYVAMDTWRSREGKGCHAVGKADAPLSPRRSWRGMDTSVNRPPKLPPPRDSAMPSGRMEGYEGLGVLGISLGHLLPRGGRLPPCVLRGPCFIVPPPKSPLPPAPASCCIQESSPLSPPTLPLWSFISLPPDREFQWVSQLPISGVLDPATLHQMTLPRCGVADTDSQAARTEKVSALFAGRWAKMRRKKRFAKQGEHCGNLARMGFPTILKPHGQKKSSTSAWAVS